MTHQYNGVYSNIGAGTTRGTHLEQGALGAISKVELKGNQQDRHLITTKTLMESELNVAKIRLVTTLPGKSIPDEMQGRAYVGFILTGVQESHNEKVEIVPLPGDTFASYFYGANPRQFNFSGILLNTEQDQWRDGFEDLYENYLRGSVSSRNFSIVQISYNGRVVSGWLTNLSQQLDSSNDHYASFSFSVLVSRVDMVGGSKKFTDYLMKLSDANNEFAKANIDTDYAVLDPTNFNGMIDPIRTGMVIPPKRPHKARRKRRPQNCWFPAETTDSGKSTNNGAVTANNHINDATKCSVIEAVAGTNQRIKDLMKDARKLLSTEDGNVPTTAEIKRARLFEARAKALSASLRENMAKDEVREQLDREAEELVDLYRAEAKRLSSIKNPTDRQKRYLESVRSKTIKVKGASIDFTLQENAAGEMVREFTGVIFSDDIDDGSSEERAARARGAELFQVVTDAQGNPVEPGVEGLGDAAIQRRKAQDEKDAKDRAEKQAKATATRLAKLSEES